jgi:hypothetical protein
VHFAAHPGRASGVQCAVLWWFHFSSCIVRTRPDPDDETTQRLVACQ